MVYIEEAHPIDGWQMPSNVKEHISIAYARSFADRDAAAKTCMVKLCVDMPALIDDIHDTTEIAYTAWPDRLYVINESGHIAYKSGPGPYGFNPNGVQKTLQQLVPSTARHVASGNHSPSSGLGRTP